MSEARAHAGLVDERFGGIINRTPFTTLWRVHVHRQPVNLFPRCGRQGDFIGDGLLMVGQLQLRVVDAIEFPEHFDKIGLPPEHMARRNAGSGPEGPPAQMLGVEDPLGLDQLVIKSWEGCSREDGVLNIEQAVIPGGELPRFGLPGFGAG